MSDNEARDRIRKAVQVLLEEGCDPEGITVRQIAAKAGVGIGTVSYHFHSKDKLVFEAVNAVMVGMAGGLAPATAAGEGSAYERLRKFLSDMAGTVMRFSSICRVQLSYDLEHGDMSICYYITPLLKEIAGGNKSDLEIKLNALEIITTMQAIFLKMDAFQRYTGLDIRDPRQREEAFDVILNGIIK
jgi:AcrR family transcriptional regulator